MEVKIDTTWKKILAEEFDKEYFEKLVAFVKSEYQIGTVYPDPKRIFSAFDLCGFDKLKVVILGQDPYHGVGQANGLSFSVNSGVRLPPSLQNIYKELKSDLKVDNGVNGNLEAWARQGVLLVNATLTVRGNTPGSHQGKGWEEFTDAVIKLISDKKEHVVFVLWGAFAQKKAGLIDSAKHLIISSAHPSPFSADRGFFGSRPFSKTNNWLVEQGFDPIEWKL